jgi:hypothetical protein
MIKETLMEDDSDESNKEYRSNIFLNRVGSDRIVGKGL